MKTIDLIPAKQLMRIENGHFGELLKQVYQGDSGVLARQQFWTRAQWSALQHELMGRADERRDPGPYNQTFLDMTFGGEIYSLGRDTRTVRINGKPIETWSAQYNEAMAKIGNAERSINFDAPTHFGPRKGFFENLEFVDRGTEGVKPFFRLG